MGYIRPLAGVFAVAGAAAMGCGSTATRHTMNKPPAAAETPQAEDATTSDERAAATERRAFRDALAMRLEGIEKEIVELRTKAAAFSGKAKSTWDETIARLELQAAAARRRLEQVEASAIGMWEKLRDDATHAGEELEDAVKRALGEAERAEPAARPGESRSGDAE